MDLFAQETATIESLGHATSNYRRSSGRRVSDDGSVIVGWSDWSPGHRRAFRWSVEGGLQVLPPHSLDDNCEAFGVSGDGEIVVGYTEGGYQRYGDAVRWNAEGELQEVYSSDQLYSSICRGISGDGQVAVGMAQSVVRAHNRAFSYGASDAPYELGTVDAYDGISYATDASRDGRVIVGSSEISYPRNMRAFRWSAEEGMQSLGTLDDDSDALAVSDDGSIIVGICSPDRDQRAFRWTAEEGMTELFGVDGSAGDRSANDVSGDGALIVGRAEMPAGPPFSTRGAACIWKNGVAHSLWDLLEHHYPADLAGWSRLDSVEGISADGTTLTGHGLYLGDQTAFRVVLRNSAPTIAAIDPVAVECEGETNVATLSTVVGDDGDRVTVRWKVAGQVVKTDESVEPGTTSLEWNFPHGETLVEVEVSDFESVTTAATTVTVQDTTAPTFTATENVVVPTDARKSFATNVTLPPPQIFDVCDGEPTLTNDAPERFRLGTTSVIWTATDADGNVSTATQRVTVKDREPPRIRQPKDVRLFCDRGETFATAELVPPGATDNVSEELLVQTAAGPRFRIGKTRVVWTARDEAGNVARATMFVTVVNRSPKADAGDRVTVEAKSERPVRVRLDGRGSSDPDGHALKHLWSAPGVVFSDKTSERPVGTFPVGATSVTLTVTDEGGAKNAAKVQVYVRLANSAERPRGAAANRAFEAGVESATQGASTGRPSAARFSAIAHSQATAVLGMQAGDRVVWEEDGSPVDASVDYATLRAAQALQGAAAARGWLSAWAEEGDEAALAAALDALRGLGYAQADLIEP